MGELAKTDILGIGVHMTTLDDALTRAEAWIRGRARVYVCHADARSILAARDDPAVKTALDAAEFVAPDGIPLVWIGRRRGYGVERVYGPDFMRALLARTAAWEDRRCRHLLLGGRRPALARLKDRLHDQHPRLDIATRELPEHPWPEAAERQIVDEVNASGADVVWVSLGAPKQELWMARNRARLAAPLLVGVGAAFDFISGVKPQAPMWLRSHGLEWAFRLATEPRRLGMRYLKAVPRFAVLALREELDWRRRR